MNLAFVLLPDAHRPDANGVIGAYGSFSQSGETIRLSEEGGDDEGPEGMSAFTLELSTGEISIMAFMPAPIPNREADENARFSPHPSRSPAARRSRPTAHAPAV